MAQEIIIKPIISEKSEQLTDHLNQYSFVVARSANKIMIAKEIERLYNVDVQSVNTMVIPGKMKSRNTKRGVVKGMKAPYKKAIITVADGETIDLYGEV